MIRIAVVALTPRLEYAADFIFRKVLKSEYSLESPDDINPADGPVLHYRTDPEGQSAEVEAVGICGETGLPAQQPVPVNFGGMPVIYPALAPDSFPFDIFSAVFFCLSRAEEHLTTDRDKHGRFEAASSIFAPWIEQPFVDKWIFFFGKWLVERGLLTSLPVPECRWINSVDIDIAYAFKGRGAVRTAGAVIRDLLQLRLRRTALRVAVLAGKREDPFDSYGLIEAAGEVADQNICFVLCGERGGHDINLDPGRPVMGRLIRGLSGFSEVGIHPSYAAHHNPARIKGEIAKLAAVTGESPRASRFHFLLPPPPASLRILVESGIERDYSMGFADAVGFRSGTAHSHAYFDLEKNEVLPIELVPLHAMDSALKNYMYLSPELALERIKLLYINMLGTGGDFVTVWHNHSLSESEGWEGWRKVYTGFAEYVRQKV